MEIKEPSGRVIYYDKEKNGEARRNDVDHFEERACSNCILQAQDDTISWFQSKRKEFKVDDLVLRQYEVTRWPAKDEKFTPNL